MPKQPSVKKGAAAQFQNWKAIKAACEGKAGLNFLAVVRLMGNGYFQLSTEDGRLLKATPRGLFGKGSMRIDVGQIAVTEGELWPSAASKAQILEIVGVIREKQEAEECVRQGRMSLKLIQVAENAGKTSNADEEKKKAVDEAVVFEDAGAAPAAEAGDGELAKGGMRDTRAKAATARAISSRAALLMKGGGTAVRTEMGEEMDARALAEGDLNWQPARVRHAKPKPLLPAYVEPVESTPVEEAEGMGFSLYSAGRHASEEVEASARAAEGEKAIANGKLLRAKLDAAPVLENWDDEVDLDDL